MESWGLYPLWQRSIHHHQIKRLKTGIKEAKRGHQQRLERDLNTNSTKDMWQVIQNVTGAPPVWGNAARWAEHILSLLYSPQQRLSTYFTSRGLTTVSNHGGYEKTVAESEYKDDIPGCVLKTCSDQLADVITHIFNISLSQRTVSSCLKTPIIIPVAQKSAVFLKPFQMENLH